MNGPLERLFVCYFHGLDERRLDPDRTPFLHRLRARCPSVALHTLPSTELLTTIITGVWPSEHGVWQVKIKSEARTPNPVSWRDRLPDAVSTTLQGLRQVFDPTFDLAAVPERRRRRFEMHRFKYLARERNRAVVERIGTYDSVFGILKGRSRFHFAKRFGPLRKMSHRLPFGDSTLEMLEVYALDLFQHWHMDQPRAIDRAYRAMDDFIRGLHDRCIAKGTTLVVLSDHGQTPVVGVIPLKSTLAHSGVRETDYSYFIDTVQARFWFHTKAARERLEPLLRGMRNVVPFRHDEMARFHVPCVDDSYGEIHLAADVGWIFFPHDFYHPLANFFMGLTEETQRTRLFHTRHKGNHGYLPEHPSEKGFAILADDRFRAPEAQGELIDVAPTLLALLGEPRPTHMRGRVVFA